MMYILYTTHALYTTYALHTTYALYKYAHNLTTHRMVVPTLGLLQS